MHKTATTSIQIYLEAISDLLLKRGVAYLPDLVHLARTFRNLSPLSALEIKQLQQALSPVFNGPEGTIYVASAEAFFGRFVAEPPVLLNTYETATDLARVLEPFDVDVSLFVSSRRQDTWLESAFQHSIKWNKTLTFEEWRKQLELERFEWDRLIGYFADHFGEESIHFVPYEHLFKNEGVGIKKFFSLFNASDLFFLEKLPRSNPGINQRWLEVLRRSNELISFEESQVLRRFLEQRFSKKTGEKHEYFTEEQRIEILDFLKDSNDRLFQRFGKSSENLYDPSLIVVKEERKPETVLAAQ